MQMMKPVAYVLPLLLLAACGEKSGDTPTATGPVVAVKAPAGTEWVTTVVETPDGGMRMGNPNAPIKVVEYGSLSCSHCAEFSEKSAEPLKANYISTGKVSYEFRNYVRDPMDLAATLLARCGGPGPFFPLAEQMFADQHNWFEKLKTVPVAEQQAIGALTPAELVKMRDRANTEFNLQVTPTFIINGQTLSDTASWEQLEAKLKAAGA
jgi:protein-disulfide isomerase